MHASSGFGRSMAVAMAEGGAHVAGRDRDVVGLAGKAATCERLGFHVDEVAADTTIEACVTAFDGLLMLFSNGGVGDAAPGLLHEYNTENWSTMLAVNLQGVTPPLSRRSLTLRHRHCIPEG